MAMTEALIPRSEALVGELVGQDLLLDERQVAQRLVRSAEGGAAWGGKLGVEAAMAPATGVGFLVPFLLCFVWGVLLGVASLVGAGIYGLRCLVHWLCSKK